MYWNNEGKYEAEAAALNDLVPMMGNCDTYKGEVWRAATKIYHDYYNNGFGNHWMQPAAFLITEVDLPESVREMLFMHANGNMAAGIDNELELMIDTVIVALRNVEDKPNTVDMWKFEGDWELDGKFWEEEVEEEDDWDYEDEEY